MSSQTVFPIKYATSNILIPFDYISQLLTGEDVVSAAVTAVVITGTDPTPSTIVSGSVTIDGTEVLQVIIGGVAGVIYNLTCSATTDLGNILIMQGKLAVVSADPLLS